MIPNYWIAEERRCTDQGWASLAPWSCFFNYFFCVFWYESYTEVGIHIIYSNAQCIIIGFKTNKKIVTNSYTLKPDKLRNQYDRVSKTNSFLFFLFFFLKGPTPITIKLWHAMQLLICIMLLFFSFFLFFLAFFYIFFFEHRVSFQVRSSVGSRVITRPSPQNKRKVRALFFLKSLAGFGQI